MCPMDPFWVLLGDVILPHSILLSPLCHIPLFCFKIEVAGPVWWGAVSNTSPTTFCHSIYLMLPTIHFPPPPFLITSHNFNSPFSIFFNPCYILTIPSIDTYISSGLPFLQLYQLVKIWNGTGWTWLLHRFWVDHYHQSFNTYWEQSPNELLSIPCQIWWFASSSIEFDILTNTIVKRALLLKRHCVELTIGRCCLDC